MKDLLYAYCSFFGHPSCWGVSRADAIVMSAIAALAAAIVLRIVWGILDWLTRPR